ncbi:MAG: lamin tail domain-containing protein, partial [Chloroflexia bacterium]
LVLSGAQVQAQAPKFGNPAFETLWNRTDGLVASGAIQRPWIWGPVPGKTLEEPFVGLPGNTHLVQFFDKGRMEINDPSVDPIDPFFITNGRLAVELISGKIQSGLDTYQDRGTAQINLASDADDPTAPTYGSFNGVSNLPGTSDDRRSTDKTGDIARTAIDRQGNTQPWPEDHPDYGARYTHYEGTTGHNIPNVFWDYLNQQTSIVQDGQKVEGPLFYPWFAVTGYPISEAYWSYVKVEGKYTDVLIQAYERRVLTFVPHLPSPFKVQMGNIGQHYYEWRYGGGPSSTPRPPAATPTAVGLPAKANVTIDGITYHKSVVDLNGTYCTITNRGSTPISFNNWRLDSPKWGIVDTYMFHDDVTLAAGASIRVHSGGGQTRPTDVYMGRSTVMWDGRNYDYAVLYDNYGRQVSDFFPAGDFGPPPTLEPTTPPGQTPGTATPTPKGGAPTNTPGVGDPTRTSVVPTAVNTQNPAVPTSTKTSTSQASRTSTVTVTPGGPTATPTVTGGNCAEILKNGGFEDGDGNRDWLQSSNKDEDPLIYTDNQGTAHTGLWTSFFGYYNEVIEDLWQQVTIPATASRVTLTYWRYLSTEDTSAAHDFLYAQIRAQNNETVLTTLETVNNLAPQGTWQQVTFDVSAYKGQTVNIHFKSTTDISNASNFFVDDISLQSCP